MKTNYKLAVALVAGVAIGGAAIQGLHAQAKPPAYVIIPILKINWTLPPSSAVGCGQRGRRRGES